MRILDCKEERCKNLNQGAPVILDYLCDECKTHFENVKNGLDKLSIKYTIDSSIVRGLDYYTKTVFEFISKTDGYTVLAGGRYDGLVKGLGGQPTPAIGFAAGEERLLSLLKNSENIDYTPLEICIVSLDEKYDLDAMKLAEDLREYYSVQTNISSRSFNAQMKYANKINAEYVIVLGEDEIKNKKCKVKNMKTSEEKEVKETKITFEVLYEDENLLAVYKPQGLLVVEDENESINTLSNQVLVYLANKGYIKKGNNNCLTRVTNFGINNFPFSFTL